MISRLRAEFPGALHMKRDEELAAMLRRVIGPVLIDGGMIDRATAHLGHGSPHNRGDILRALRAALIEPTASRGMAVHSRCDLRGCFLTEHSGRACIKICQLSEATR